MGEVVMGRCGDLGKSLNREGKKNAKIFSGSYRREGQ
jgi:hypothetical protein